MKMNSKIALYSVIAMVVFALFFYFYKAPIFEAKINEGGVIYTQDVALRAFLDYEVLPEVVLKQLVTDVVPTWKGGLILVIGLIGLPLMLGYRLATNGKSKEKKN